MSDERDVVTRDLLEATVAEQEGSPSEATAEDITARAAELAEHDRVRDIVVTHVDELSLGEMRALGRWLAAIERGRMRLGVVEAEGDRDLEDAVAYLELQRKARHP